MQSTHTQNVAHDHTSRRISSAAASRWRRFDGPAALQTQVFGFASYLAAALDRSLRHHDRRYDRRRYGVGPLLGDIAIERDDAPTVAAYRDGTRASRDSAATVQTKEQLTDHHRHAQRAKRNSHLADECFRHLRGPQRTAALATERNLTTTPC